MFDIDLSSPIPQITVGVTPSAIKGEPGTVFYPDVDAEGNLSCANDGEQPNPPTVNIRGDDGVSPLVQVSKEGDITTIQITDVNGTQPATIEDGIDAVSPTVQVDKTNGITTITVTDIDGDHTATINDGIDGVSPTVEVNKAGGVTTITITDADGTKIATIDDGVDGVDGTDGTDGTDGVSPTVDVNKVGKITTITIVDASGTHIATINDGIDGTGSGDMSKIVYDTDEDGIVDIASLAQALTPEAVVPIDQVSGLETKLSEFIVFVDE